MSTHSSRVGRCTQLTILVLLMTTILPLTPAAAAEMPNTPIDVLPIGEYGLNPKSKSQAILNSLLLPGSGQRYKGQKTKGWLFTLGVAGSAGFAMLNESARKKAVEDFKVANIEYSQAITQADMDAHFAVMQEKWSKAEDKKRLRNYGWFACGGIWLLNLIDAALGWPAADVGVTVGQVPVETSGSGFAVTIWR